MDFRSAMGAKLSIFAVAAAFGALSDSNLAYAGPKTLVAPCIPGDASQVKMALANGIRLGERACTEMLTEAKSRIEQRVRDQAEAYYQGCDLDPAISAEKAIRGCRGRPIPTEVCDMLDTAGVPKTFNLTAETTKNHIQRSCGDWPYFQAHLSGSTCNISPDYTKTTHYIEDAFNRGGWIQALNCYHQQVQAEIAKGKIKLTTVTDSQGNEVPGPCLAMAKDFDDLSGTSDQMAKTLESKLGAQKNVGDMSYCAADGTVKPTDNSSFSDADPNAGKNRQSACQLRAARRSVEAAFMQLAACEVWARAGRSYESFLGRTPASDSIKEQARAAVNGRKSKDSGDCSNDRILNQVYIPHYMAAFKTRAEAVWNANSCAPLAD